MAGRVGQRQNTCPDGSAITRKLFSSRRSTVAPSSTAARSAASRSATRTCRWACIDECGSGQVGGRYCGARWNDRWNPESTRSPTEHQSGDVYTTGHPVSSL